MLLCDVQFDVNVALGEPGTAFFVVLPAADPIPSPAEVKSPSGVVNHGSFAVPTPLTQTTRHVTGGLTAETEYHVVLVAQDDEAAPNLQTLVLVVNVTTGPDVTPPKWRAGYPTHRNLGDFELDVVARLDEPGTCTFLVLYASTATPTVADVLAGTGGDGSAGLAMGTMVVNVSVAGPPTSFEGVVTVNSNLAAETEYDVYLLCSDDEAHPNQQASVASFAATTLPDETPPVFGVAFPRVSGVADFAATVQAALDEPGRWFWAVVPANSSAPTPAQIVGGTVPEAVASGSKLVAAGAAVVSDVVTGGLLAATRYDVWSTAQDDEPIPNVQTSVAHMNFTTLPDETPPVWLSPAPVMTVIEDFTLAFDVVLDEPSTVLWVVVAAGATSPSVTNVRAGEDGAGNPGVASGSYMVMAVNVSTTVTIHGGLSAVTAYDVYLFAEVRRVVANASVAWMASTPARH